jgi:hypothetical protein
MKYRIMTNRIFFIVTAAIILSCSSDDDTINDNTKSEIENIVKKDTWRITKYIDSGDDELHHFTGYNFTFGESSVLTASNGTNTHTGTWSITNDSSSDDSSDDLDFNIFFASPNDFEELSEDWDIISQSATKIELIDISGGNGGTDYLTFERN